MGVQGSLIFQAANRNDIDTILTTISEVSGASQHHHKRYKIFLYFLSCAISFPQLAHFHFLCWHFIHLGINFIFHKSSLTHFFNPLRGMDFNTKDKSGNMIQTMLPPYSIYYIF